jgi:WD40 repeat protein
MTGHATRGTPGSRAALWITLATAAGIALGLLAVPAAERAAQSGTERLPALRATQVATLPSVIAHQPVTAVGMSDSGIIGYGTAGGDLFLQRPMARQPSVAARLADSAIRLITFSATGSTVAGFAGAGDQVLWAWDTTGTRWSLAGSADKQVLSDIDPDAIALSPGGSYVAIDSNIGLAVFRLRRPAARTRAETPALIMLTQDAAGVDGVLQGSPVFNPRSTGVLTATIGTTKWSLATGRGVRIFTRCPCESATISQDNTTAVVDELGYVEAWDLRRGVRIGGDLAIPQGAQIGGLAIDARDNVVAVGTTAGTVLVWDPYEDRAPTVIKVSHMNISEVALSADGKTLLVAGSRLIGVNQVLGTASLWVLSSPPQ